GQRPAIGVVRMAQSTAIGKLPRHEPAARIVGKGLAMPTAQQSVFDRKQPPGCIVFGVARLHWMVDAQRLLATPENPARDPFVAPRLDDLQRPARRIATERPVGTVLPGNAGESVEAIVLVGDDADAGILAAHQATEVVVLLPRDATGRIDAHPLAVARENQGGGRCSQVRAVSRPVGLHLPSTAVLRPMIPRAPGGRIAGRPAGRIAAELAGPVARASDTRQPATSLVVKT